MAKKVIKYIHKFSLLFNTIKYLKFRQIYFRFFYKLVRKKTMYVDVPDYNLWNWNGPLLNKQSLFKGFKVKFLNEIGIIKESNDWNCNNKTKLWLYNLHYFDDLCSTVGIERNDLQFKFINKWIKENPAFNGNGWEPYPTSLRLVNWVKWCSVQTDVSPKILKSVLEQALFLNQRLEYHILGNHLFANAKAITFVGAYLKGKESEKLLKKGIVLVNKEIGEQFLPDGAHFELSPMYHAIMLLDLLELIDLAYTSNHCAFKSHVQDWVFTSRKALNWFSSMLHKDGHISFFNDSSFGIALAPNDIFSYANKLGIETESSRNKLITHPNSSYSKISQDNYSLIFDHADVGPDHLPGHAHADTLSFEMSVGFQRVFVNSGTSMYGVSEERQRQRKTSAHNTVSIGEYDSSQVWSGFRVAKRAYCELEDVSFNDDKIQIVASHNGYLQQKPNAKHTRKMESFKDKLVIKDYLSKTVEACAHFHLHPNIVPVKLSDNNIELQLYGVPILVLVSSMPLDVLDSTWHPEFGKSVPNKKIKIFFYQGKLTTTINIISESL